MVRKVLDSFIPTTGPNKGKRIQRVRVVPDKTPAELTAKRKQERLRQLEGVRRSRAERNVSFLSTEFSGDPHTRMRVQTLAMEAAAFVAQGGVATTADWRINGVAHTFGDVNGARVAMNAQQSIDLFKAFAAVERQELLREQQLRARLKADEELDIDQDSTWAFDPEAP